MTRNRPMIAAVLATLIAGVPSLALAHDVSGTGGQGYVWPCPGMMGQGMGPGMMMGPGMGPGMMGPGMMGPGMMGQGMGPGMMGPGMGMMGQGMGPGMGPGMGMMGPGMGQGMEPGIMGPGMGMMGPGMMQPLAKDLTAADVQHMIEHQLAWQRNPNLKPGKVEEKDEDTITAEIVTQDGSLVQRLEVDRHTGLMRAAQ